MDKISFKKKIARSDPEEAGFLGAVLKILRLGVTRKKWIQMESPF